MLITLKCPVYDFGLCGMVEIDDKNLEMDKNYLMKMSNRVPQNLSLPLPGCRHIQ